MKIGWNVSVLKKQLSGVGNYIEKILKQVKKLGLSNKIVLFGSNNNYNYKSLNFENLILYNKIISKKKLLRVIWEQIFLPLKLRQLDVDILHCPAHVIPIFSKQKSILTIHDLAFKLFPKTFKWQNRIYLNFIVPLSIKRADKIIAVSNNTKNDIVKEYNVNPNKINVIYNGLDEKFKILKEDTVINKLKAKYELPQNFILYLGTLEPRKNLKNLIKAFDNLEESNKKLVIAGGKGWLYKDIFSLVREKKLENDIIFTGYVDKEDIVPLYNAATLFVYPSLYEGFGLPPLEAMACGTPVITSNVSSLPEVVGDAAITVDPKNINELSEAISNVLSNEDLQNEIIQRGIERAKLFTWENAAIETVKVYEEVLEQKIL